MKIGEAIKFYLLKIDVNEKHALRLSKYLTSPVAELWFRRGPMQ